MPGMFFIHPGPKFPDGNGRPPVFRSEDDNAISVVLASIEEAGIEYSPEHWGFTTSRPETGPDKLVVKVSLVPEATEEKDVVARKLRLESLWDDGVVNDFDPPEIPLVRELRRDPYNIWTA